MNRTLSRRVALGAALTAPLVSLSVGLVPAHAASGSSIPASTGFLTVPVEGVLIGLLLPAVQAAREAARLQLIDSRGLLMLSIPLGEGPAFFDVFYGDGSVSPAGNPQTLVVTERGGGRTWEVPTSDGVLIALLLPAIMRNGSSAGFLAGSVQVRNRSESNSQVVPLIEQNGVHVRLPPPTNSFVGPFTLTQGEPAQVGLLLPAVQKVREAARLRFLTSDGVVVAQDEIIAPPEIQAGHFTAFYDLIRGDGSVRVERRTADGSVLVGEGSSSDGILIGLLLPAVRTNRRSAGLLGGSLQTPSMTVAFQETHG